MEYKTRQWHEKCFCCVVCKNPIGTKSFIPREQEIYCAACYEDKFATRCVKCNKVNPRFARFSSLGQLGEGKTSEKPRKYRKISTNSVKIFIVDLERYEFNE